MKEVGQLEAQEQATLQQYRQTSANLITRIGELEVQKSRLMGQLGDLEDQTKALAQNVVKRLGIDPTLPWSITPAGKVLVATPEELEAPPQTAG